MIIKKRKYLPINSASEGWQRPTVKREQGLISDCHFYAHLR